VKKNADNFDNPHEKSGIPGFIVKGAVVSVLIPAIFAAAGFLMFIPYLNLAAGVLLVPLICALCYRGFSGKVKVRVEIIRVLTGVFSLLCAWVFLCVMTGVLSGVYGWEPLEIVDMLYEEPMDILMRWQAIGTNALVYFYSPGILFEDIAAWNEEGWLNIATAGFVVQAGLPQLLVKRRR
jgi:hypothetical protein